MTGPVGAEGGGLMPYPYGDCTGIYPACPFGGNLGIPPPVDGENCGGIVGEYCGGGGPRGNGIGRVFGFCTRLCATPPRRRGSKGIGGG